MIWVEILWRHREVAARYRFADQDVLIGRGYDNDVILDDPYVAARHMRVFRDETGRLVAEDLGSANGMYLHGDKSRQQRIVVDGERPIRIGHTYLRFRDASHEVEGERVATTSAPALPIALATALGGTILGIEALAVWFAETSEPKASSYLQPLRDIVIAIVAWVAMWALFSRIFSGRARFLRNLLIALSGVLAYSLYNEFAQLFAFALTWRAAVDYGYVAMWSILAAVCVLHLREVSPSRLPLTGGLVVTLFALIIAVQTLQQSEVFYNVGRQTALRRLMPPVLRLVPVRNENAFFAEIERLKTRIDSDRREARADDARR